VKVEVINKGEISDRLIIMVHGSMDSFLTCEYKSIIEQAVENSKKILIEIDISNVNYIDSNAICFLVKLSKKLDVQGRALKVSNPIKSIESLFKSCSLNNLIIMD